MARRTRDATAQALLFGALVLLLLIAALALWQAAAPLKLVLAAAAVLAGVLAVLALQRVQRQAALAATDVAAAPAPSADAARMAILEKELSALQGIQKELVESKRAAESSTLAKSEFLATMSHEIRTPLNGVLGFAEIGLRHAGDPDKAANAFAKILLSGRRLLGVINDVLDFSKIEAGKLSIEQTRVALAEVVEHAVDLVRELAAAKGIALRARLAADLPADCVGDPLRIGQVLLNLLSNAVKFTEEGSVDLDVRRVGDELVFRVVDTGIGMDETQRAELFNPFHQADASSTRRFGGTGLGLAISKRILELMDGSIELASRPGDGTTVEFRLPYRPFRDAVPAAAAAALPAVPAKRPLAGLRCLVAEDEEINRLVIGENLEEAGASVVLVGNGREAVERVEADGPGAYDLVLMDLQMPEMDGYAAAGRIAELAPGLPVVAQTAHAFNEERERCLAAGMVDHLAKPIDPDALVDIVRRHARRG